MKPKRRSPPAASQQPPKLTKKQRRELNRQEEKDQKQLAEMTERRTAKRVMIWSGLLGGLVLAVSVMIYLTTPRGPEAAPRLKDANPTGWTLGNPDAPITLVEYSDYQCPLCVRYHRIVKQLTEKLGKDFRLIVRPILYKTIQTLNWRPELPRRPAGKVNSGRCTTGFLPPKRNGRPECRKMLRGCFCNTRTQSIWMRRDLKGIFIRGKSSIRSEEIDRRATTPVLQGPPPSF